MKLKAILVDDEATSRNVLREYIQRYCPQVIVVAEADSVQNAIPVIQNHKPDILFLDVEMPKGNGFDLLEQIGDVEFETIFVTAYDHYAIQALNYSAAYYLLKPVSIDELIAAVDKIVLLKEKSNSPSFRKVLLENIHQQDLQQKKIVLPLLEGFEVVRLEDIVACEAHDNFTDFYFTSRSKMMICRSLKFYEELLQESGFLRVHKSHLINLEHVVKYNRGKGGIATMSNGQEIAISAQKKDQFLERFERGR
ncbi:MAG: LytR/AlgR family response regulator transcription factor [Flavobacteriales bacterium]